MIALGILQDYLDTLSRASLEGDWNTYRRYVGLPFVLVTDTATLTVSTEDMLRGGFDEFTAMLRALQVTDYIRLAEDGRMLSDDLLAGFYVSHLLSKSVRVLPPFRSQITLRRVDGIWLCAAITNALSNARWPISLPVVSSKADQGTG